MRYEDLPPGLRSQVDAKLDKPAARKRDRKGQGTTGMDGWCATCGERYTQWAAFDRHSLATGHRRLELLAAPE